MGFDPPSGLRLESPVVSGDFYASRIKVTFTGVPSAVLRVHYDGAAYTTVVHITSGEIIALTNAPILGIKVLTSAPDEVFVTGICFQPGAPLLV